jgi:hypothetical protein
MRVPAGRLRDVLGITHVNYVAGSHLGITAKPANETDQDKVHF